MGKIVWVARREQLSSGSDFWEVKDRFNGKAIDAGLLPSSYEEVAALASKTPACSWDPAYIWLLYGPYGIGKTRSLLTFPRPLYLFNLDKGQKSISREVKEANETEPGSFVVNSDIDPEHGPDYDVFLKAFADLF